MRLPIFVSIVLLSLLNTAYAKDYRHSSGVHFSYDDGWTLEALEDFSILIPNADLEHAKKSQNPEQFILVGANPIDPALAGDSPLIGEYFDELVSSSYPTLKRVSGPSAGADGYRIEYQGDQGRQVDVRYRLQQGLGLFMAHAYLNNKEGNTTNSTTVFENAFASYKAALGADKDLLGSWFRSDTSMTDVDYDSDSDGSSYASSSYSVRFTFDNNNRMSRWSSATVYSQADTTSYGAASSGDSESDPTFYGTYTVQGESSIHFAWDNGNTAECTYGVFEDYHGVWTLKLACGKDKPKFYAFEQ